MLFHRQRSDSNLGLADYCSNFSDDAEDKGRASKRMRSRSLLQLVGLRLVYETVHASCVEAFPYKARRSCARCLESSFGVVSSRAWKLIEHLFDWPIHWETRTSTSKPPLIRHVYFYIRVTKRARGRNWFRSSHAKSLTLHPASYS